MVKVVECELSPCTCPCQILKNSSSETIVILCLPKAH